MRESKLPKLSREVIRETKITDSECWHPHWHCYCCYDSGVVDTRLVRVIIPNYDPINDKLPLCQASRCNKSFWVCKASEDVALTCDWRFVESICNELASIGRKNWQQTTKQNFDSVEATKKLANDMSLRKRDRSWEEENLSQQKHHSVLDETDDQKENRSCELEE